MEVPGPTLIMDENNAPGLPEFLTVREAAVLLRVNTKTIYAEITAKRIRAVRLGRSVRIPRAVIAALCGGASSR